MRPPFIGNYRDFLDEDNASYPGSSELLSIGSSVGKKLGLQKIGIHIELLPPGRRTSWPHAESSEEEFAFVLDGNPDVWIDGHLHSLKEGDFVAFPSGTGISHTFINNSTSLVRLLVGGERTKSENKIVYPLNEERNLEMKAQGQFWEDAPLKEQGPHDGLPDFLREGKPTTWNLPTINTDRLQLRKLFESDIPAMFAYAGNPNVARFLMWEPHKAIEDTKEFFKFVQLSYLQGIPRFGITLKERSDFIIGEATAFWVSRPQKILELGVVMNEDYWGKGFMSEALKAIIDYCWANMDVIRIQARCKKENSQSFRMLQKSGMHYEGTLYSSLYSKGRAWDMEMFSIVRK